MKCAYLFHNCGYWGDILTFTEISPCDNKMCKCTENDCVLWRTLFGLKLKIIHAHLFIWHTIKSQKNENQELDTLCKQKLYYIQTRSSDRPSPNRRNRDDKWKHNEAFSWVLHSIDGSPNTRKNWLVSWHNLLQFANDFDLRRICFDSKL